MSNRNRSRSGAAILSPNLTPLLDVVLQLITFFMMLIHFGTKVEGDTASIRLPITSAAMPNGDLALDRLAIAMDATGRLLVEGDEDGLDESEANLFWEAQAKVRRQGLSSLKIDRAGPAEILPTIVVVRADRDTRYGAVRRMLSVAQEQGFAQFSLIVKRRPGS